MRRIESCDAAAGLSGGSKPEVCGEPRSWAGAAAWGPVLLLILLALPLFTFDLGRPGLADGEAKHAEVPRVMVESGDGLTPTINGTRYLEKPPLVYWLTALSYLAFGVSERSARLPNALAATALVVITYLLGARLYGRRAGFRAAVVLATSIGMHVVARECGQDLFMTLALTGGALALAYDRPLLMWAALGSSLLIKGPIGLALPGLALAAYLAATRDWSLLPRLRPLVGLAVALGLALPWHVAMAVRHADFPWFYLVHEHLLRFLGRRFPQDSAMSSWLFVAMVGAEFFPWFVFLAPAVNAGRRDRTGLFAATWMAVVVGFFALSVNKQDTYGILIFPAAAILVGRWWTTPPQPRAALGPAALAIVGIVAMLVPLPSAAPPIAPAFLACMLAGCTVAALALAAHRPEAAFAALALMMVPLAILVHRAFLYYEPERSSRELATGLRDLPPDSVVVLEEPDEYEHAAGMNFYLKRRVLLVRREGDSRLRFTFTDPESFIVNGDEIETRARAGQPVYWVGIEGERAIAGNVVARSGQRVAIRVSPASAPP